MKPSYLAVSHPKLTLAFLGILTLGGLYFLTGARMDNSLDVWLARKDPKRDFYDEFRKRFGTEEYFLVALCQDDAFSPQTMELVETLTQKLESLDELQQVESLSKVYSIWKKSREEGGIASDLETFRKETLNSPFYVGLMVSPTGRDSAIMAQLTEKGMEDRQAVAERVKALVSGIVPPDRAVYYAGSSVFNAELNAVSRRSMAIFYPLIAAAGAILLVVVLRSKAMTLAACSAVVATIVWGVGAMVCAGRTLNVVTSALPAIVLVSTVSYALHFLLEYRRQVWSHHDKKRAVRATLDMVEIPCLLSAVTTAQGFGSLMIGRVEPVVELGIFAGLAVLGGYVAVVYGLGAFVTILPVPKRWQVSETEADRVGKGGAAWHFGFQESWYRARWLIIFLGFLYTAVSAFFASRVYFEANPFEFFPEDNVYSKAHNYLERELFGLSRIQIQIRSKEGKDLTELQELKKVEEVGEALKKIPYVTTVITAADFVKETRRSHSLGATEAYQLPRRQIQLRQILNEIMNENLRTRFNEHFAENHTYAKLTLRTHTLGSREYGKVLQSIQEAAEGVLGESYEVVPTGLIPLVDSSQKYMVLTQVQSISLALALISLVFILLLRSIRFTVLGLLPNLIPILGTFGFMGWMQIPLDVATIMVASVSLGIVVDNTIHFLFRYRRNLRKEDPLPAVVDTLRTSGQAITFAGAINCLGFAVLIFSGFQPMKYFGLLVSLTMLCALLGATILLPALLVTLGPGRMQGRQGD